MGIIMLKMFDKAQPVWLSGREQQLNCFAAFRTEICGTGNYKTHIAASTFYRLFINDKFVCFGPARTVAGYARVDVIPLDDFLTDGKNKVVIEVVGYNCRTLSTAYGQSFLTAEIFENGESKLYTGKDFEGFLPKRKLRAVERYSGQRHFGEIWDERFGCGFSEVEKEPLSILSDEPIYIGRVAPYPLYNEVKCSVCHSHGSFEYDESLPFKNNRYSSMPSARWGIFAEEQIEHKPYRWIQKQRQAKLGEQKSLPLALSESEYAIFDLNEINVGFIGLDVQTEAQSDIVIGFSEYFEGDSFQFSNINAQNVIEYFLPTDKKFEFLSFEPYALRFAIVMVKKGKLKIDNFYLKTYERDMTSSKNCNFENTSIDSIFRAAKRTFAHNALDIYMDCPSRERAGWLCDSYFTARSEMFFCGDVPVERDTLENFRLFKNNGDLPEGVLPMCCPSDVQDNGNFIPQWNMWYILESEEYLRLRNPNVDKELFRESIYGILSFLAKYENVNGLLQNLPKWNFVEWSTANKWTQDINYPTNMLYSAVLEAVYRLYGDEELKVKCKRIRECAVASSFNGELFTDNAVITENSQENTGNISEACQYYTILFGGIDINDLKYEKLKSHVLNGFEKVKIANANFVPVNAFIGLYLRIDTLLKMGEYQLLINELDGFFGGMASKTGTLWEYRQMKGSFDHGFASYAAVAIHEAFERLK